VSNAKAAKSTRTLVAGVAVAELLGACGSGSSPHAAVPSAKIDRYVALTHTVLGPVGRDLSRHELIADARTYCGSIRTGADSYSQVLRKLTTTVAASGVSAKQAKVMLDLAIATFCPKLHP